VAEVSAGPIHAPIIPLGLIIAGAYLTWFGVHYWSSDTKWPTDPVKSVLQGNGVPSPQGAVTTTELAAQVESGAAPATGPTGAVQGSYDHARLEALWTANGGSPATANVAAAVAQAESSGRTEITSPNPDGGINVGLWQLDTRGVGAGYAVAQLQDPTTNARVTVFGSANGTNWSAWETYVNGNYKKFLSGGITA
jgi:hypothetical protein